MSDFIYKLKRVKVHDILQIWKLIVAVIPAFFYRLFHPHLWIICEDANEARDNGYWMFKYIRETYPDQEIVYAINRKCPDYAKVKDLGRTVQYYSLMHWILYLASEKQIGSQKAMNPNAAIFYALEVYGILKNKRVFLQHGITINDGKWLYYDVTKMNRFICGAYPEYEFIKEKFGYPEKNLVYTGFARFDRLHEINVDKKMVLIMPTWREWIADEDYRLQEYEGTTNIPETNYFRTWTSFLENPELKEIADAYGVHFIFFPHRNMQKYAQYFPKGNEAVEVAFSKDYDIQDLLKRCALLITDYSSVFFDVIYMKKPVIFYQFDYDMFRKGQYQEGYFDYRHNPFSESYDTENEVIEAIGRSVKNNYRLSDAYEKAHAEYFPLFDTENCERIYQVIREL